VLTAYDTEGNESGYSNEVFYQPSVDVPPSNLSPGTPIIVHPANGQDEIDVPLNITTEPFSDPNDDFHSQQLFDHVFSTLYGAEIKPEILCARSIL